MKKRISSLVLALAVLLSCVATGFSVIWTAAEENELLISDCETLNGWTKTSGNGLTINNNGFGTGSKAVACDINSGAFRDAEFKPSAPLDISAFKNIEWDVMMHTGAKPGMWDDIKSNYGDEVYLKIGSSAADYNVYRLSKMTVEQDSGNNLWYHFSIDINDPSGSTGSFDKTKMTFFHFATKDGSVSSAVRNGHLRIDNIYARNLLPAQPEETEDLILSECETLENWSYAGAAENVTITTNGMTGNSLNIYTGYAALRKLSFSSQVDISEYNTLEFDMRVMKQGDTEYNIWNDITESYGDKIGVEVSDGTNTNTYGLNKWNLTELGNGWYHVSINLYDPTTAQSAIDFSKFESFSVYTNTTATLDNTIATAIYRIDNLLAHYDDSIVNAAEKITISDCESLDNWSYAGNAANMNLNASGMNGKAVYVYTGYGALRKLSYTAPEKIDISLYHRFEFDFMCVQNGNTSQAMWEAISESYKNYIGVEISDGKETERFKLSDMEVSSLSGGWYHAAVEVPSDSKVDLASFKKFTFYTLPETPLDTSLSDVIFKLDNLSALLSEGKPSDKDEEGVWSIEGSFERTSTGTFSFILNQFELDLSKYQKSDLYLTMRVYIANKDGSDNVLDFTSDGQIELTSSGVCDVKEANWSVPKLGLKSGWNELRLSLANAANDTGHELSKINYFRFYSREAGSSVFDIKIQDIKITSLKEESIVGTYFSDGMMFKQNKPMNVFGNVAAAGLNITAMLKDKNGLVEEVQTVSTTDGSFELSFAAREGGYNKYSIELYVSNKLVKTIKDILIGELWLAAGQSNMEFFVLQTIPDYDYDLIPLNEYVRFFDEPLVPGGTAAALPATPAKDIEGAKWADGSNAVDVKYVSAIAYYMSIKLQNELNVPVGFINAAKGASVIESWLDRETVESDSVIKDTLVNRSIYKTEEQLAATASNWTYLTTLYNSKIAPLAGIEISGVLWYQGESNIKYADKDGYNTFYEHALSGLIASYSKLFGFESGNMPFVCAHLAPYNYSSIRAEDHATVLATFAEMLSSVSKSTNANMIQIPIYDLPLDYVDPPINNPDPIHPNSKDQVAQRFAVAVLSGVYGIGDASDAPTVESVKIEGNKVIVTFDNVGSGLKILNGGDTLQGFAVCDSSRVFVKAKAEIISKNSVAVYSDKVSAPVAFTYAWSSYNMQSNLCNSAEIPAVPYRSDKENSTYYLSMDWAEFDSAVAWDAKTSLDAGNKPAYSVSDNAEISLTDDKLSGSSAVKLSYEGKAYFSPVLSLGGMINQYPQYSGITVSVKNTEARSKKLALQLIAGDETYYASVVTGNSLAIEYTLSKGGYSEYTFNLKRIVNSEGKVLRDSKTVLKTVTALNFCIEDEGSGYVLFDNAYLRADELPAPGSENDELTDAIEDTTAGSLDSNGNMWLNDGDTVNGWSVSGSTLVVDNELTTQGKGSVGATASKGVLKQIVYSPGVSVDISEYDYLEFDVYFSNMMWFNASESVMFEMTSSGASDNESNRYMKGYFRDNQPDFYSAALAGTETPAWYHVKLILNSPQTTARGGMDATRFNYFRFFAIGAADTTPDFEIRFDNMKFTKEKSGEVVGEVDPSYGKVIDDNSMYLTDGDNLVFWSASGAEASLDFKNKTQGNSSVTVTANNGLLKQIAFAANKSIDISDYQYLELDVYFSSLDWYKKCKGTMFELTSAGTCDKESNRYTKSSMLEASPVFAADIESGNGGGKWYHFKFNLDRPHTSVKGGLDKTAFDYFRFYTVELEEGTESYTMLLDNLRFTKGEKIADVIKTDEHIIINNADSAAGWSSPGQEVMFDQNNKTEGTGSVNVTAKNGILKELAYRPAKPIDLTGYNYLQFDLFLSDITCLNSSTGFMVEMTSSGVCDVESNRFMKSAILAACPELAADLSAGVKGNKWYSFCFNVAKPQNQARGGLDMTKFNYFRIYFIGAAEGTPDCVVNIDNLRVTAEGVKGLSQSTGSNQSISFGSSSSTGKNVGNKVNGGLLADPLTPKPEKLIIAVLSLGGVIIASVLAIAVILIVSAVKRRKRR